MDLLSLTFPIVNTFSTLVVASHVFIAVIAVSAAFGLLPRLLQFVSRNALVLMLIVAIVATSGSLFLSEIAMWNPCKYCWLQRIFMYPQVILLAIALRKKDRGIIPYILALSIFGIALASYHYFIQMQNIVAGPENPATPCDASGESCVTTPFVVYGYVTIPMMAFTAFALNIVGSWVAMRKGK